MKKSPESRLSASAILAAEVADVMIRKLRERGRWAVDKIEWEGIVWHAPGWKCSWIVTNGGVKVARLNVSSHVDGVHLAVRADDWKMFTHDFRLHNTDSPRKVACLLVEWLKQAQIRSVMSV